VFWACSPRCSGAGARCELHADSSSDLRRQPCHQGGAAVLVASVFSHHEWHLGARHNGNLVQTDLQRRVAHPGQPHRAYAGGENKIMQISVTEFAKITFCVSLCAQNMNWFLLLVSANGKIIFISTSICKILGHTQVNYAKKCPYFKGVVAKKDFSHQ
jgi:hypothetical protein